jgi:hypothetical protein
MDERLRPLFDRAFKRSRASEANIRIQEVRDAIAGAERVSGYEVVVGPDATLDWFSQSMLPRFVYHLESLGVRPPEAPGVFVSLFLGEELYFVHARDVLAFASEALGLSSDDLSKRYGTHERPEETEEQSGPPPALPGFQDPS